MELQHTGASDALTLASFVALWSGLLRKPVQSQMVVLGDMSLGGNVVPVMNLAETLQAAFDGGARRILLPMARITDILTLPGALFAKFQTSFYSDPVDAVLTVLHVSLRANVAIRSQVQRRPPTRACQNATNSVRFEEPH